MESGYHQLIKVRQNVLATHFPMVIHTAIIQRIWKTPKIAPSLIWEMLRDCFCNNRKEILIQICNFILNKPNVTVYNTGLFEEDNGELSNPEKFEFSQNFKNKTSIELWKFIWHNKRTWYGDFNIFSSIPRIIDILPKTPDYKLTNELIKLHLPPQLIDGLNESLNSHNILRSCKWVRGVLIHSFCRIYHIEELLNKYKIMETKKYLKSNSRKEINNRTKDVFDVSDLISLMENIDKEQELHEKEETSSLDDIDTNSYAHSKFYKWLTMNSGFCLWGETFTIDQFNLTNDQYRVCVKVIIRNIKQFTYIQHPEIKNEIASLEYLLASHNSLRSDVERILLITAVRVLKNFIFLKFGMHYGASFIHPQCKFLTLKKAIKTEIPFQSSPIRWYIDQSGNYICKLLPVETREEEEMSRSMED